MDVVFHGGKCCGVKSIFGFEEEPQDDDEGYFLSGKSKAATTRNEDTYGYDVRSDLSFFTDAAPEESYLDRFHRLVDFTIRRRPSGVIEVILAKGEYVDQLTWEPILLEKGFKKVTSALNSNSNNTIHIYHLVSLNGEIVKE